MEPIEQEWRAERCTCSHLRRMHFQEFGECAECDCEMFDRAN
jgi:hypothetical protein